MSLVAGPGRGGFSQLPAELQLCAQKHVDYIQSLDTRKDELEYWLTEHLRMSGIYWGLTPLYLLGQPDALPRSALLDFVLSCLHENGGFGAAPGHDPHMLYTVSAVQILATLDAFDDLEQRLPGAKHRIVIASLQKPDNGTFAGDEWGETDTRFLYGAFNALSLLGLMHLVDVEKAIEHVQSCANFDGGYGTGPGAESHSGQVFTCVGTLAIANRLDLVDIDKLGGWLSERQLPNGGLNGRPEKLEDVCYSWWVVSSLAMIDRVHWIDQTKLAEFILKCQDPNMGGISDRAGDMVDVFHTHFGIAGLSLLQYPGLLEIDPVYCMPRDVTNRVLGRTKRVSAKEGRRVRVCSIRSSVTLPISSTSPYYAAAVYILFIQQTGAMRPPKIRITARVLRPPEQPTTFLLAVEEDATFQQVWNAIEQRYKENYGHGRKKDWFFKKIQDDSGADIDIRDTVIDIFGAIEDPHKRIVQVQQLPLGRDDTVPFDSHLHPPLIPPTPEELDEINRRRSEFRRYGATLDNLDPDHPVESHETPAEKRIDQDGFAIPARINRPSVSHFASSSQVAPTSSQVAPSSQLLSQDSYEEHLVRSPELGSPLKVPPFVPHLETPPRAANTASQYSTLDAVPSAQKPPVVLQAETATITPPTIETTLDVTDPISEDSQPRLSSTNNQTPARSSTSNKRKSLDSSEARGGSAQKSSSLWSEEEIDLVIEGLAKGLSPADIKQYHLPARTVESVRKKAKAVGKKNAAAIEQRKASIAATWTEDEEAYFVRAIRDNRSWKSLHDLRFVDRSDDSVKFHFVQVRERLQAENKAKIAQARHQEQLQRGQASTGPNEKFAPDEDDFLLACRIENVEMKRVAKEFFPLRSPCQITSRANNLFQEAKRAASKANPLNLRRSPSVEFLFENDAGTRDRLSEQLQKARDFKKKSSGDRTRDAEEASRQRSKINNDKERADERRAKETRQLEVIEALETFKKQDDQVKQRRLNDDLERDNDYKQQLAVWTQQSALDKEAGRPIQPRPSRPLGSGIGTEVLTTDQTPRPSSDQKTSTENTHPGSSTKSPIDHGNKRRRSSVVEVQVVIPCTSKKQKTKATAEATPQTKPLDAKAASTSKLGAISTPKRTAPSVAQSAMAKITSIRGPSFMHDQKVNVQASAIDRKSAFAFASISATQPTPMRSTKDDANDNLRNLSSPGWPAAKSLRQSKLPFLRNGQHAPKSSARKSKPVSATPRPPIDAIDDSVFISSDEESSYDDKDLTDEALHAAVERSEAMYSSSPTKSPQKKGTKGSPHKHQNLASPGASAFRSSPPVASIPTPKAKPLYGKAALESISQARLARTPKARPTSITNGHSPDLKHNEVLVPSSQPGVLAATQEDKSHAYSMPGLEMSTAEPDGLSDPEEDALMLDEDQIEHATHSTPVFLSSSPEIGAQETFDVASFDGEGDTDMLAANDTPGQLPVQRHDDVPLLGADLCSEQGKGPARNDPNNVVEGKKVLETHTHSDSDDVESIKCWRSDSIEHSLISDYDQNYRSDDDDEMPFPKPTPQMFGPFRISNTKRTTHLNASVQPNKDTQPTDVAQKENVLGEKTKDILDPLPNTSIAPATQSKDDHISPFTSPTARPSEYSSDVEESGGRSRRGQGRKAKKRRSRILDDAHLFRPPPSTAPPDISTGLSSRKKGKQPVKDSPEKKPEKAIKKNRDATPRHEKAADMPSSSKQETTLKKTPKAFKPSKEKRRSLGLDESLKNVLEKGQAFGSQPQATPASERRKANKPASTQPAKKATPGAIPNRAASSQPAANTATGQPINARAFDWDNAQDPVELMRQADQRMRDAANMRPEDFWRQSNLVQMNEEQILSHMIEQGVQRSMNPEQWARDNPIAAALMTPTVQNEPATQPARTSAGRIAAMSTHSNDAAPRSATQPAMQTRNQDDDDDTSMSSDQDDSDEEDAVEAIENMASNVRRDEARREEARRAEARRVEARRDEARRRAAAALPNW
ncbi:hypothetical protein D6D21_02457 [Aureobasidium pullulans]|uniref:protein geranylgeranyltransferase type II n=1 Tax=Aureobasidium pullulans TaxID=5580 RepID=A0AB74J6J6_AURPU|nr:hypothetical protein D6D21_02457 [Aureobasidium pullulans]